MNIIEKNQLVKSVEDLYFAVYRPNPQVVKYKRKKFWFFKEERKILVNTRELIARNICSSVATDLKHIEGWEFRTLYDFSTFVKVMEKIFYYPNDKDCVVVCDSKLSDSDRSLKFQFSGGYISIMLFRIDEHEKIKIVIAHDCGRQMFYAYEILDGEINCNINSSDAVSLVTIIDFIGDLMSSFYTYICNMIITKAVSEMFTKAFPFDCTDTGMDMELFEDDEITTEDYLYLAENGYLNDDLSIYNDDINSVGGFRKCRFVLS